MDGDPQPPAPAMLTASLVELAGQPTPLDDALRRLEFFLSLLGFLPSITTSVFYCRLTTSCIAFLLLGVALPATSLRLSSCHELLLDCGDYQNEQFELFVLVSGSSLAAVSLGCLSWSLSKYGIRRFLFVDKQHGRIDRFQEMYVRSIKDFFSVLLYWVLPCFIVKTAREISRFSYIVHHSVWRSIVVFSASIISWIYLSAILLSSCSLFSLVCSLQGIHFEDYGKLLEQNVDASVCLEEHTLLRHNLSKISHRFRMFLLLLFLFVTASQFVTLIQITGYSGTINFTNAGDLAVSSVVQVVGVVLCLNAAAKISHRAQGIAALASKWHAFITCGPIGPSQLQVNNGSRNSEAASGHSLTFSFSENYLDSMENGAMQGNTRLISTTSYQRRLALVMYLQSNHGGITIFGWVVDRALLDTLFCIELTLVLFVLSNTVVFPS